MMNAASIMERASLVGPSVRWMTETMLTKAQFPQQAYGKCQAIFDLVKTYGRGRVENACRMMKSETSIASLKVLTNILKNNRDFAPNQNGCQSETTPNDNVRGATCFNRVNKRKEGSE